MIGKLYPALNLGFGARIGAGFSLLLLVSLLGYAVGLNTTSSLSDATELLRRAEQVDRVGIGVRTALDAFEVGGDLQSAHEVDAQLDMLKIRLSDLADFIHQSNRDASGVTAAQRSAQRYEANFDQLKDLETNKQEDLGRIDHLLERLADELVVIGERTDRDFASSREAVDTVDVARNAAASAADTANALMVALNALRQIESLLIVSTRREAGSLIELADTKFAALFAAIPRLKETLPEQHRSLRKFERWLKAFKSTLVWRAQEGTGEADYTRKMAAVLLQTAANNLYRTAVSRHHALGLEARTVYERLDAAIEGLSLVRGARIQVTALQANRNAMEADAPGSLEEALLLLERLRTRIAGEGEAQTLGDGDWRDVLDLVRAYQNRVVNRMSESVRYREAALNMAAERQAMERHIDSISAAEHRYVSVYRERADSVMLATGIGAFLLSLILASWITRHLSRELGALSKAMHTLAEGETQIRIPYLERQDQTGNMARALEVFRANAVALRQNQWFLEAIIENIPNMLFVKDAEGLRFVRLNMAGERLLGLSREEVIGKSDFDFFPPHQARFFVKNDREVLRNGDLLDIPEECVQTRYRGQRYLHTKKIPIRDENGNPLYLLGISEDITEYLKVLRQLKDNERHMEHLAHHDKLTGLPNRLLLRDRIEQGIHKAHRIGNTMALLFLDLDRFKQINDSLGHLFGDRFLQQVAQRLSDLVRDGDTVSRIGGDEFVIVLEWIEEEKYVGTVAQDIIDAFAEVFRVDEHRLYCTSSVGISLYPQDGNDADTLLRNADAAMYKAKEAGGNDFRFYTEDMTTQVFERLVMETQLRRAIDSSQFSIYYQPQVSLSDECLIGAEALIRWRHPDLGLVFPTRFIPLAEENGLIVPIGIWVLRTACITMKNWLDQGLVNCTLSVNLSARQLHQTGLVEQILDILETVGLPPDRLELEITEGSIMANPDRAAQLFKVLRDAGIQLAVDDFGTGYSSLAYLKQLPITRLKIDQSFVRDIPRDPNDMAIARAVIALGRTMKLQVVAEGVETIEQAQFLRSEGCDCAQGHLFSGPLSESAMDAYLRS